MKTWNGLKVIAVIATGVFLPVLASAEYSNYNPSTFSSNTSTADSILKPLSSLGSRSGAPADSLSESLSKNQEEIDSLREKLVQQGLLNQQRAEKQKRNQDGQKQIDKNNKALFKVKEEAAKKTKEAADKTEAALAAIGTMKAPPPPAPLAPKEEQLEDRCKAGVNLKAFDQMSGQLASEPFQYMRQNLSRVLNEKNDEYKKEFIKRIVELNEEFEKRQKKAPALNPNPNAFKPNINDRAAMEKALANGEFGDANGIKALDDEWAIQKPQIEESFDTLRKTLFTKVIPDLLQGRKNSQALNEVKSNTIQALVNYQAASLQTAQASASRLAKNCQDTKNALGGQNLPANSLTAKFFNEMRLINLNQANFFKQSFAAYDQMQCVNSTQSFQQLFGPGSLVQTKVDQLNNIQEPVALLQGVDEVLKAIQFAQGQVDPLIDPSMQACQRIAFAYKELDAKEKNEVAPTMNAISAVAGAPFVAGATGGAGQGSNGGQFSNGPRGATHSGPRRSR